MVQALTKVHVSYAVDRGETDATAVADRLVTRLLRLGCRTGSKFRKRTERNWSGPGTLPRSSTIDGRPAKTGSPGRSSQQHAAEADEQRRTGFGDDAETQIVDRDGKRVEIRHDGRRESQTKEARHNEIEVRKTEVQRNCIARLGDSKSRLSRDWRRCAEVMRIVVAAPGDADEKGTFRRDP